MGRCREWSRASLFAAGFWLAVVLVSAKGMALGMPLSWTWPLELMNVSFQDVIFALAIGGGAEICARLVKRPQLLAAFRTGALALCALCALYGVVAYGVFDSFGRPLSYDLLMLMRNAAAARSSITDRLTWQIVLALLGVPIGLLLASIYTGRRRAFPPIVVTCMALWIGLGLYPYPSRSNAPREQRLALSPHMELIRSTVTGLAGNRRVGLPREFPVGDLAEIEQYGNRAPGPRSGFQIPANTARPKNVIVIVLESVGMKYLSLYGSRYDTTPNLVAESKHAAVFDRMYAHAPYTFCSFMAVNFSIYPGAPWCYAPGDVFEPRGKKELPPTLASLLQPKGWRTAYLHNGDMDWGGESVMLDDSGYETVEDYRKWNVPQLTSWGTEDHFMFDRLIQWIDEKPGQPFLAYCWTDQTHNPYAQRPGTRKLDFFGAQPPKAHAQALAKYLNVLHETDGHIGRLFAALRERGLADDTLVVVTGDHGEAFADPHDQQGHGFTVYDEEVHVPFMIWNPRLFPEGCRLDQVGGHVDLNPTVADLLGVDIPDEWQGYSLFVPDRPDRTFFVANVDDYYLGIREGRWKYFFESENGEALYDLDSDPSEQTNAINLQPALAHRLRQRVAAWLSFEDQFLHGASGSN